MTIPIVKKVEAGQPIPKGFTIVKVNPDGSKAVVAAGLLGEGADIYGDEDVKE